MVKLFIIAICQTITVKQKRFYKLSKVDMKEGALLAYYGMSVVSPIDGFPNVSHKHSRSMLIFSPLNISFEADFRAPLLTTYMLQFFPPAKPHAGRVVLLPHSCYNGTDWRPCGGDAEPYPLTSLVRAAPGPTFPSWLHVCETVAAKVCQARKKINLHLSLLLDVIQRLCPQLIYFLGKWMQIVVNRSFTFLKWINTWLFRSIPPPLLANIHNEIYGILCLKIQAASPQMRSSAWLPVG